MRESTEQMGETELSMFPEAYLDDRKAQGKPTQSVGKLRIDPVKMKG
jgi:hypothetical protein